jgi:hypothetical protein
MGVVLVMGRVSETGVVLVISSVTVSVGSMVTAVSTVATVPVSSTVAVTAAVALASVGASADDAGVQVAVNVSPPCWLAGEGAAQPTSASTRATIPAPHFIPPLLFRLTEFLILLVILSL